MLAEGEQCGDVASCRRPEAFRELVLGAVGVVVVLVDGFMSRVFPQVWEHG